LGAAEAVEVPGRDSKLSASVVVGSNALKGLNVSPNSSGSDTAAAGEPSGRDNQLSANVVVEPVALKGLYVILEEPSSMEPVLVAYWS
jgi:hypothetical protein